MVEKRGVVSYGVLYNGMYVISIESVNEINAASFVDGSYYLKQSTQPSCRLQVAYELLHYCP